MKHGFNILYSILLLFCPYVEDLRKQFAPLIFAVFINSLILLFHSPPPPIVVLSPS